MMKLKILFLLIVFAVRPVFSATNRMVKAAPRQISERVVHRKNAEKQLIVLKNEKELLPLRRLDTLKIASVSIGNATTNEFQQTANLYTVVADYQLAERSEKKDVDQLLATLSAYNLVLLQVYLNPSQSATHSGVTPDLQAAIQQIVSRKTTVVTVFGNPHALVELQAVEQASAIVMAAQLPPDTQDLVPQLIFGAIPGEGKLAVTIDERFKYGDGVRTPAIGRLKYTIPEEVGLNSERLEARIDSIIKLALEEKATPGGVIQLARDGKVFYRKAFGKHTYEGDRPVRESDLYDLASVTKVSAATPALMGLYDQGLLDLDKGLGDYLHSFRKSNKADMKIRDLLTHSAGLKAFIVFWKEAQNEDGTWKKRTFRTAQSRKYSIEIVPGELYLHRKYPATMARAIRDSPSNAANNYVYSDLSFTLYPQIVKQLTGQAFDQFLETKFYKELGASSLTFNPLRIFEPEQVAPTEIDTFFRHTRVHGRVHDEAAAMMGGVSGHAGLFGNANDVMKLWQMFLQKGNYGGKEYLSRQTVETFTRYQYPEKGLRRGLGFDKPSFKYTGNAPRFASPSSYGHTGFTGTMTWVDPAWGLNYVFLSNRVYPYRSSAALGRLNIRTGIMDVVYEELMRQ